MEKTVNGHNYDSFRAQIGSWGMPDPDLIKSCKQKRLPLPADVKEKRRLHMVDIKNSGYPISWIAKLYSMSRMQATRIINNLPNN